MTFEKSTLITYQSTELQYPQKFAQFSFHNNRLSQEAYTVITENISYIKKT